MTYEDTNDNIDKPFHAVDFMRQVRSKLSDLYLTDKQKYLEHVRKAMENFKLRQKQGGI